MGSAGSRQRMVLTFPYSSFSLTHFPGERWRHKRRVWLESCRTEPTWWRRQGPVSFSPCYRLPVTLNAKWAVPQWLCSCFKSNPVWSKTCRIYDFVKQGERGVKVFFFFPFFLYVFQGWRQVENNVFNIFSASSTPQRACDGFTKPQLHIQLFLIVKHVQICKHFNIFNQYVE